MAWEQVDAMPGGSAGGAFRGAAEPVVARRTGMRLGERLRLFWHSTPELPTDRAARRLVLTPRHLYVERVDGSLWRVQVEALRGDRLERGLLVIGVKDDEDLLLPYRAKCEAQDRLLAAVRGESALEPWRAAVTVIPAIVFSIGFLGLGIVLLLLYPIEPMVEHFHRGLYTSESSLGVYGGFASLFFALFLFVLAGSRWRVDAVGLTRSRGALGLMHFTVPPERFRRAVLEPLYIKPKRGPRYLAGWKVSLELRDPQRVGSILPEERVILEWFYFGNSLTPEVQRAKKEEALALAERLRALLGLTEAVHVEPART